MNSRKLAIFMSHPTQMEAPLFRKLTRELELKVYYWKTATLDQLTDPELGHAPGWDFPLVEGYPYEVIPADGFFHRHIRSSEAFRKNEFDAVLINGYGFREAQVAIFMALSKRIPVIIRSDTTMLYGRNPWKEKTKEPIMRLLFKKISAFMATGSLAKNHLMHYGVPEEKIFHLPYAIDNERFAAESAVFRQERAELRESLRIPPDQTAFLAVIKLTAREGCHALIRGFASVARLRPSAFLVIVGDGPDRRKLEQEVAIAQIPRVIFTGYQPYSTLPRFYAIADAFIHPALFEPWGVSVNEAMACGLPVIASDRVGAAHDLVLEGENGFLYKGCDPDGLSRAMLKFLDGNDDHARMAARSAQLISSWGYDTCLSEINKMLSYIESGEKHG